MGPKTPQELKESSSGSIPQASIWNIQGVNVNSYYRIFSQGPKSMWIHWALGVHSTHTEIILKRIIIGDTSHSHKMIHQWFMWNAHAWHMHVQATVSTDLWSQMGRICLQYLGATDCGRHRHPGGSADWHVSELRVVVITVVIMVQWHVTLVRPLLASSSSSSSSAPLLVIIIITVLSGHIC